MVPCGARRGQRQLRSNVSQETIEPCADAEFGWFLPTSGDTTCYGDTTCPVPPSLEMFDRVRAAAEAGGFEYLLVPVDASCWDAYICSAMMLARSQSIRMLVAARPGYINPVLLGKMITAMDQLSGGRISST